MIEVNNHRIVRCETAGSNWKYTQFISHAAFDGVESALEAVRPQKARKKVKTEVKTEVRTEVKTEPKQEPKQEPAKKPAKVKAKPVKPKREVVDISSDDENSAKEYVEQDYP